MNLFLHLDSTFQGRTADMVKKSITIMLSFLILIKTFFFMRLFRSMAHLVSMMQQVMKDLQAFLIFFFVLIWITSFVFSTIGLGNPAEIDASGNDATKAKGTSTAGKEYQYLPRWLAQWFSVLRIALADFDFAASMELEPFENILYWMTWVVLVIITCIIFLNFIIAEVSSSYESIKTEVNGCIEQDRAQLINESEDMLLQSQKKNPKKFPRYLVRREVDD